MYDVGKNFILKIVREMFFDDDDDDDDIGVLGCTD